MYFLLYIICFSIILGSHVCIDVAKSGERIAEMHTVLVHKSYRDNRFLRELYRPIRKMASTSTKGRKEVSEVWSAFAGGVKGLVEKQPSFLRMLMFNFNK